MGRRRRNLPPDVLVTFRAVRVPLQDEKLADLDAERYRQPL
jgi:hypothetical protein